MGSTEKEVSMEVFPYLRVLKDGNIERIAGTETVPAGLDSQTSVLSKDVVIVPETGVSARLYLPPSAITNQKLPLVVYFHGGAFCIATTSEPKYHASLNNLVAEANVVVVSVNYRLAPEHPLPAAYDDSWAALQWVASHNKGHTGPDDWLNNYVDFDRVFLAGDSAGANIAHHMGFRAKEWKAGEGLKFAGMGMIHPYFWGTEPIGMEIKDRFRKEMVDGWWKFVCPSEKGCDDPLINPFVDGAPSLKGLECEEVLVIVAGEDILRERGRVYYEELKKSGWEGRAEMVETGGKDHVFHIFDPNCDEAKALIKRLALFVNQIKHV